MARRSKQAAEDVLAVAFAGGGDSSEANTTKLLNAWDKLESEDQEAEFWLPDRILRAHKGLKNVVDWLTDEFGEDSYGTLPKASLVGKLVDEANSDKEPFLIFIPGDELDAKDEEIILEAQANDIPVLNLTEGLDELLLEVPKEEPKESKPKSRGKSRGTTRSVEPDEAQSTDSEDAAVGVQPGADSLNALLGIGEALYQYVIHRLIKDGYLKAPKPSSYPCWVTEDGDYRPRLGKGRGRKGETSVDLSEAEVQKIDGLLEQFQDSE